MVYLLAIAGALLVYFSFRSFVSGICYLRYFQRFNRSSGLAGGELPFATVIAPCRGIEPFLADNLRPLLQQNYPHYEVIFAVDDICDPAVLEIEQLISDFRDLSNCTARLVVAEPENRSGRKVEVLREAVLAADPKSEVFVFVDSDARPRVDWLAALVAPLDKVGVGATTGYRWFLPTTLAFAGQIRAAWNASIASALGENEEKNFCWGGSTAISRKTFEQLNIRDAWLGTASDDFILTRELRRANLGIVFVPSAITLSPGNCNLSELLEFTTRQMKITRVYSPNLWLQSLLGSGLFVFVTAAALVCLGASVALRDLALGSVAAAILVLISILSVAKVILRARAVELAMADFAAQLRIQALVHCLLWPIATYVFFYNAIAAAASRRIVWRGIEYQLTSDSQLEIIEKKSDKLP